VARYRSSGFEIGNTLDARAYPTARTRRSGPPPAVVSPLEDPFASRGAPIRVQPWMVHLREAQGVATCGSRAFVGPALIKHFAFGGAFSVAQADLPWIQLNYATTPYASGNNQATTVLLGGTPIFLSSNFDDAGFTLGRTDVIVVPFENATFPGLLLNYYVPETNFFLGLAIRNTSVNAAAFYAMITVYEAVLLSDYPHILA
jgi:hypothetical protein